jgi:hypothetical protein
MPSFLYLQKKTYMAQKVVIIVSNFYSESNTPELRELPELDKLFADTWEISSITPVVDHKSSQSSRLGSMQLIVRLQK